MSMIFAPIAVLIILVAYWARGPRYALGALLMLAGLYAAFVWLATASMS